MRKFPQFAAADIQKDVLLSSAQSSDIGYTSMNEEQTRSLSDSDLIARRSALNFRMKGECCTKQ